jgi:hypothetical protein
MADIIDLTSPTGLPPGTILKVKTTHQLCTVTEQDIEGNIHYEPTVHAVGDEDGYCRFSAITDVFELPPDAEVSSFDEDEPMEVTLPPELPEDVVPYTRLTVQGKYTILYRADGKLPVLRYGEPWLDDLADVPGSKCILALVAELEEARERIAQLEQAQPDAPDVVG